MSFCGTQKSRAVDKQAGKYTGDADVEDGLEVEPGDVEQAGEEKEIQSIAGGGDGEMSEQITQPVVQEGPEVFDRPREDADVENSDRDLGQS